MPFPQRCLRTQKQDYFFFSNKIILSPQPKLSELVALTLKMDLQVQKVKSKVQHDCYRGSSQRGVNESGTNVPVEMVTVCVGDAERSPG